MGLYTINGRPFTASGQPVRLTQEKFEECCCVTYRSILYVFCPEGCDKAECIGEDEDWCDYVLSDCLTPDQHTEVTGTGCHFWSDLMGDQYVYVLCYKECKGPPNHSPDCCMDMSWCTACPEEDL